MSAAITKPNQRQHAAQPAAHKRTAGLLFGYTLLLLGVFLVGVAPHVGPAPLYLLIAALSLGVPLLLMGLILVLVRG